MRGKIYLSLISAFAIVLMSSLALAQDPCNLEPTLLNQDPYPAVPGDYVKLVFKLDGVSNTDCGNIEFELLEQYPLSFDPGKSGLTTLTSGGYAIDYENYILIPYKVRIDEDVLDGDNEIKVRYRSDYSNLDVEKTFNINVQKPKINFEITVKDYDSTTNTITFEILNIGENDAEAVTADIKRQQNFALIGTTRNIIGSLDSNDDTTFTFKGTPSKGEIVLSISYTDTINERRTIEKTVEYDPELFKEEKKKSGLSPIYYVIIILAIIVIFFWWRARAKKKRLDQLRNRK